MESVDALIDLISIFALIAAAIAAIKGSYKLFVGESGTGMRLVATSVVLAGLPAISMVIMPMAVEGRAAVQRSADPPADPAPLAPVEPPQPPPLPPPADPVSAMPPIAVGEPVELPTWFWRALGVCALVVLLVPLVVMLGARVLAKRRQQRELRKEIERLWILHARSLRKLKRSYTAAETDPWTAFRRPLLTDVTEPLTAKFHEKFARARELDTEYRPTSRELVDRFGDAVREANAAWAAADQHARAVAVPTTSDAERRRLRRAEDALRLAMDERTSPAERAVALARVEQLIAGLTAIPYKARTTIVAELETKTRLAISGG
ncbi:MAG: hypothetical protein ACI39C_14940 [Dietzia sp.]